MSTLFRHIFPLVPVQSVSNARYIPNKRFFTAGLHLVLCTLAIFLLGIEENKGFDKGVLVLLAGFFLYTVLKPVYRKAFLALIALVFMCVVTHWIIAAGVFLVLVVFVLLTFIRQKNLLYGIAVLMAGAALFLFKGWWGNAYLSIVTGYAAVFLMIRYIYLLYELNYFKTSPPFIDRFNYLFMIPNASFPLFPPVDPKIFINGWYAAPSKESFEQALLWISRGILHTVCYRILYMFLVPSPFEIENFWGLLHFVLASYTLLLRLSGIFYISLGFVMLFGYKFPPTFDHYFFANSFADLWRRVNLFWRDFCVRVFYFPLVTRMKKIPPIQAVFWATIGVFVISWLLHGWQWFWIKGTYVFAWNDFLFWYFLGMAIAIGTVLRMKKKPVREISLASSMVMGSRVVLTFLGMSLLWSMWTAESLGEWLYLLTFAGKATGTDYLIFVLCLVSCMAIAGGINYLYYSKHWFAFVFKNARPITQMALMLLFVCLALAVKTGWNNNIAEKIVVMQFNQHDRTIMERGYYEQILSNDKQKIEVLNLVSKTQWNLDSKATRKTNNILLREFLPDQVSTFKGDSLTTNAIGIRDRNYVLPKPPGTVRIAVLGGSYEMGSGVADHENYPALLEEKYLPGHTRQKVEILNFGFGGYHLPQAVYVAQHKLEQVQPDYVFYVAHSSERQRMLENFIKITDKKVEITDPALLQIKKASGITPGMSKLEKFNRLRPFSKKLINWGYGAIAQWCRQHGVVPVWIYLPVSARLLTDPDLEFCLETAREFGFETILLNDVYHGYAPVDIQLSSWDAHPNPKGHDIIAHKLFEEISRKRAIFKFLK